MNSQALIANSIDPRTTLAFFGGTSRPDTIRDLYQLAKNLFTKVGYPPNVMAVTIGKKYGRYRRLTRRGEHGLDDENLAGAGIAYVPGSETDVITSGWMSAGASKGQFIFHIKQSILGLDHPELSELVFNVAKIMSPIYGFGYTLEAAYGPGFHAVGMLYEWKSDPNKTPPLSPEEQKRTSAWRREREEAIPAGMLRDVYLINYLTQVHATKKIDSMPLVDWIKKDSARGTLSKIKANTWLWRVPEDRCLELGNLFESAGLLVPLECPPPSPEDMRQMEEFLKSGKLFGPGTLVIRPGDKDFVEAQSPQGLARINSSIERLKASQGKAGKKQKGR